MIQQARKGVKYKVVTKLGEGSFGGVFQVSVGGYDFAVKQFNEERAELDKRPEFVQNSDFFLKLFAQNNHFEISELGGKSLKRAFSFNQKR